jgi:RNA polymerase sigma-70 factor (ECF subfamily)
MRDDLEHLYRDLRPYAFAIAYRMLGSVSEAEDIVQEAFLRLNTAQAAQLVLPKAYLAKITTRLAIDALRSARITRQSYYGPWLPEPLADDYATDAADRAAMADSLTMAFLVVLEKLSPVERAVFLLHDVFDFDYPEISTILDKNEANCRQLASRARRRLQDDKPRFQASREQRERLAERFFAACQGRDINGLVELLAGDAVFYGDGGTKGTGVRRPIYGRDGVIKLIVAWFRLNEQLGAQIRPVQINGQPGARFLDPDGRLINVVSLDIVDDQIQTIRSVVNPDKLSHLGPLSPIGRRTRPDQATGDEQ